MNVIVLNNQTLADITVQEKGSIAAWFEVAMANNLGLTEDVSIGKELTIQGEPLDSEIVSFYRGKAIKPATWTQTTSESTDCDICKYFK